MSAATEYLLKLAYDERNLYRAQLQQNWIAPLQSAALLLSGPYLFKQALEYIPDFEAFVFSHGLVDYPVGSALIYPVFAVIFLGLQLLPPLLIRTEKELAVVAKSFVTEEEARLRGIPIELCPHELQDIILEIVRLRLISVVIQEIYYFRRKLAWRSWLQATTTVLIVITILSFAIVFITHRG